MCRENKCHDDWCNLLYFNEPPSLTEGVSYSVLFLLPSITWNTYVWASPASGWRMVRVDADICESDLYNKGDGTGDV